MPLPRLASDEELQRVCEAVQTLATVPFLLQDEGLAATGHARRQRVGGEGTETIHERIWIDLNARNGRAWIGRLR
jgi:hypothetical protein